MKLKNTCLLCLFSLLITACNHQQSGKNAGSQRHNTAVSELVNDYSEQNYEFNPVQATITQIDGYNDKFTPIISDMNNARYLAFQQRFLKKAELINVAQLAGQDLLTYKIFLRDRQMAVEGNHYPSHLIPINQMYGNHNLFAQLGSGQNAQPFTTVQDYRNFIKRANGFALWMDSAIAAMREGIELGIIQPLPIVKKIIPQLKAHLVVDLTQSVFYGPLQNFPPSIDSNKRERLIKDYLLMLQTVIIPAYQRMYAFMSTEYLAAARESVGFYDLPEGQDWYKFLIKTHTTLNLSANEIHQYGQNEVARILREMKKVKSLVQFKGDMAEFFEFLRADDQFYFNNEADLIKAYTQIKTKIDAALPKLFDIFPKANYEVRAVPAYRAASSPGASYEGPAPDGSRPGIFFINAYNLRAQPKFLMETLSVHEASPGHHFQIAIQQELKDLPDYRKFGSYTVFAEGWALYAESLGKELGLFSDPYMWYGRLVDEQLRAMRLVVDTGLHAKRWSRQQAIDYMLKNSSMALSDVEAEVERYIVIPGQALSYKIGQRKIRQLRKIAEQQLGASFNLKKFHTQILIDGSLPMPILEEKINRWIETSRLDNISASTND